MSIRTLDALEAHGRRVGVRVDVNSPITAGELADDARLLAHLETLSELTDAGGKVAILAHQGRPGGEEFTDLAAHAERFDELLEAPVDYADGTFCATARDAIEDLGNGEAVVLENTRFYSEETMDFTPKRAAETHLVTKLAPSLDAFVNDAFAAAHRAQASMVGFAARLPAYAGRVMETELEVLGAVDETDRPRVYVFGGAKVQDSIYVAERVLEKGLADEVLTSGIVGNLFLSASGTYLGDGTAEVFERKGVADCIDRAASLLEKYQDRIRVPTDVVVDADGSRTVLDVEQLPHAAPALDVGPETAAAYAETIENARTAVLNGPAGVAERDAFADGTRQIYQAATRAPTSIVGGGDTAAALRRLGIEGFTHLSTGGGAALTMLAGDSLPTVEALRDAG
jgi:phosphoglycerate kinase